MEKMEAGTRLLDDQEFENAKKLGYDITVKQGELRIVPPGKILAVSEDFIYIGNNKLLRSANEFYI